MNPDESALPGFEQSRAALLARAAELGWLEDGAEPGTVVFASPDAEQALLLRVLEHEVPWKTPGEHEARRWFDAHAENYRVGARRVVSHVLYGVTPRVPVGALREHAERRLKEVLADPARFEALAREESNCPSGAEGGGLGTLERGQTVPEFEQAVFEAREPGLLPLLLATRFGFHIVRVDRIDEGEAPGFEACREAVERDLATDAWLTACRQYLQRLASDSPSPLVQ